MELLIPDSYGIYIPKHFWSNFDFKKWNLNKADYSELSSPDNDYYWDYWDDLLYNAHHIDDNNTYWYLHQNGDLFAITEHEVMDDDY